ncbi:D-2-hydroxyacid dehydrogenase [Parafrigoribacterium mesophilum]|uniref:D-2-hydroxyacid dehydrogenase n=1 Tax=Parafrigoribacterium mesophilum TaxID=433646 RepID=UPI0031FBDCD5
MTDSASRLRVVAATPISEELIGRVVAAEPRIDFIRDQALLPPMRFPGDHSGDPAFHRSAAEQLRFDELVDSADALYGVPDCQAASLARVVNANPCLRWVHTMAAGGGAKVKAARLTDDQLRRVAFSTSAGVHAKPLAEYAVFALLAGAKTLPRLLAQQRQHLWARRWTMKQISGQRILIVGLGSIGRATALMLRALGATVIGASRHGQNIEGVDEIIRMDQLAEAAGHADGIVVALPGTAATDKMLDEAFFAAVQPGAAFVSVGRGTVIDETALIRALDDGRIAFAAMDVFAHEPLDSQSPLWQHPSVLISPHTAALEEDEDRLIAELFARNATRFLDGLALINRVDTVEFY